MSLADTLIEDFEIELQSAALEDTTNDVQNIEEIDENEEVHFGEQFSYDKPVTQIAKLYNSNALKSLIDEISSYETIGFKHNAFLTIEANPEYQLIVKSNDKITDIDNEIAIIHKYVKDIYNKRFSELSTIVPDPIQYFKSIQIIGNKVKDISKMKEKFTFFTSGDLFVLSIGSTTVGENLSENRLTNVLNACDMALDLQDKKDLILQFVESRMPFYAPNLSALVGAPIAAKLIGYKGGLRKLAETPGSNILNIGAPRKVQGIFNNNIPKGCGYIYQLEYIQKLPKDLRVKTAKQFGNKAALAVKVDLGSTFRNGEKGYDFLMQIQKTVDRWKEPPPVKLVKALPAPIDLPSKRRGGKRYRKRKERLGMTEVRKSANRMEFGSILDENYDNDITTEASKLAKSNKIRVLQADPKTKSRISKTLNKKLQKQNQISHSMAWGGMSTIKKQVATSGVSTSVTFTENQGLEISTPIQPNQFKTPLPRFKYF